MESASQRRLKLEKIAPDPGAAHRRPRGHESVSTRRGFRGLGVVLSLVTLFITAAYAYFSMSVWAVVQDGRVLGYVSDIEQVKRAVDLAAESEAARIGAQVTPVNPPSFLKTRLPQGAGISPPEEMGTALSSSTEFQACGWVIRVDGKDVVALASEDEARMVLSELRAQYERSINRQGSVTIESILIKEDIDIENKVVSTRLFRQRDEALRILARGTDRIATHVVQRGECLWTIAQANHMTVEDLKKANPQITGDLIRVGETLNLVVPVPYVTFHSTEKVAYKVDIPYATEVTYDDTLWPWQEKVVVEGKKGQKLVTVEIVRENGQEIQRRTVDERIVAYPVTRKVVRGSKQVPPMGSGQMAWPVQGRITSNYGWRWGSFHSGVDIAAPTGTPVLAADSGMVSFRGWNGGYGRLVLIDHGNGIVTAYAHLSGYAVELGETVKKGQVVGYVGSSGNSTGPHLHFEVRVNGVAKNPLDFYK